MSHPVLSRHLSFPLSFLLCLLWGPGISVATPKQKILKGLNIYLLLSNGHHMNFCWIHLPEYCDRSDRRCSWQVVQTGPSQRSEPHAHSPPRYWITWNFHLASVFLHCKIIQINLRDILLAFLLFLFARRCRCCHRCSPESSWINKKVWSSSVPMLRKLGNCKNFGW